MYSVWQPSLLLALQPSFFLFSFFPFPLVPFPNLSLNLSNIHTANISKKRDQAVHQFQHHHRYIRLLRLFSNISFSQPKVLQTDEATPYSLTVTAGDRPPTLEPPCSFEYKNNLEKDAPSIGKLKIWDFTIGGSTHRAVRTYMIQGEHRTLGY